MIAFLEFLFLHFFCCVIKLAKVVGKILIKKINYDYHLEKENIFEQITQG